MTSVAKTLILCDFDGTASPVDVGNRLLNRFTGEGWEEIDRDYCTGKIGSRAAYERIAPLFRGARAEMIEYALAIATLDGDFAGFYRSCRQNGIDVKIVSDGLDFYIEALLASHGLADVEYHANCAVFDGHDRVSFEFPGASEDCGRCGNCKRAILNRCRPAYGRIIYIGDSHSDICPAQDADLVFAKTVLYAKHSNNRNHCIYIENFDDVIKCLHERCVLI
ncbi:MAG: phosphatase [Syntrophus sp. (in: bacteria)]|nr:phosphatase [Syntrophus sp. (in: bacteria)]